MPWLLHFLHSSPFILSHISLTAETELLQLGLDQGRGLTTHHDMTDATSDRQGICQELQGWCWSLEHADGGLS